MSPMSPMSPTTDEEPTASDAAPMDEPWSTSVRGLWLHAAALAVVLSGIVLFLANGYIAHPDEAVYSAQADALSHGSWRTPRPAADVDIRGIAPPLLDSTVIGDTFISYARHPAYPLILLAGYAPGGQIGMLLISVLGTVGAAVTGAFMARRFDPRYGLWALWILGLASPLLFDSFIVVGHSLEAAFAGLMWLGLVRVLDDDEWGHLAYAIPAAILTVLIRSEGIVLVIATAAVVCVMSVNPRKLRAPRLGHLMLGTGLGAVAAATYLLDNRWASAILGSGGDGPSARTAPAAGATGGGRLGAAWASLLQPYTQSWIFAHPTLPLIGVLIIAGALAARFLPSRTLFPVAACAAAGLAAIEAGTNGYGAGHALMSGLLPAFPILVAALILLSRSELRRTAVQRILGISVVAAILLVATIYSDGGAEQWGGRFFHPLLVPLMSVILLTLDRVRERFTATETRIMVGAFVVVSLSFGVIIVTWNDLGRRLTGIEVERTVDYALTHRTKATDRPLVMIALLDGSGLSRSYWNELDRIDLLAPQGYRAFGNLARRAAALHRPEIIVLTDASETFFRATVGRGIADFGWHIVEYDKRRMPLGHMVTLAPINP